MDVDWPVFASFQQSGERGVERRRFSYQPGVCVAHIVWLFLLGTAGGQAEDQFPGWAVNGGEAHAGAGDGPRPWRMFSHAILPLMFHPSSHRVTRIYHALSVSDAVNPRRMLLAHAILPLTVCSH
jgi:hypothetical protein